MSFVIAVELTVIAIQLGLISVALFSIRDIMKESSAAVDSRIGAAEEKK